MTGNSLRGPKANGISGKDRKQKKGWSSVLQQNQQKHSQGQCKKKKKEEDFQKQDEKSHETRGNKDILNVKLK